MYIHEDTIDIASESLLTEGTVTEKGGINSRLNIFTNEIVDSHIR